MKFKRNRSASRQMVACFFAKFCHVATIPLEHRRTVTADWYVNHCLPKIFQAWCKRRPGIGVHGLLLHYDNASAHTAAVTLDFLAASDVQLVNHPPYSPDLAPCDWFLFPSIKRQLKGTYPSQRGRVSLTAGLRGWSNVYKLRGVSSKNWSK